jgi:hypothetical protein
LSMHIAAAAARCSCTAAQPMGCGRTCADYAAVPNIQACTSASTAACNRNRQWQHPQHVLVYSDMASHTAAPRACLVSYCCI